MMSYTAKKCMLRDVDYFFLISGTRKRNCNCFSVGFFVFQKKMLHITVVMAQLLNSDSTVLITHSFASVCLCN